MKNKSLRKLILSSLLLALGMVLPATAEHKGYLYCKARGQERYLAKGDSVTYHLETGLLDKAAAAEMEAKIHKLGF